MQVRHYQAEPIKARTRVFTPEMKWCSKHHPKDGSFDCCICKYSTPEPEGTSGFVEVFSPYITHQPSAGRQCLGTELGASTPHQCESHCSIHPTVEAAAPLLDVIMEPQTHPLHISAECNCWRHEPSSAMTVKEKKKNNKKQ